MCFLPVKSTDGLTSQAVTSRPATTYQNIISPLGDKDIILEYNGDYMPSNKLRTTLGVSENLMTKVSPLPDYSTFQATQGTTRHQRLNSKFKPWPANEQSESKIIYIRTRNAEVSSTTSKEYNFDLKSQTIPAEYKKSFESLFHLDKENFDDIPKTHKVFTKFPGNVSSTPSTMQGKSDALEKVAQESRIDRFEYASITQVDVDPQKIATKAFTETRKRDSLSGDHSNGKTEADDGISKYHFDLR